MTEEAMTIEEAIAALNGCEYGEEGSKELFSQMKISGLVAVFGASDDLIEFRGAIDDEVGAWDGGTVYLTSRGLLANECDSESCPHFRREVEAAEKIVALWDPRDGLSWAYETAIPHQSFDVVWNGERYCEGIVFRLSDVSP